MDGLAKAGQIHEAKAVFEDMRNKNVKSGIAFYPKLNDLSDSIGGLAS